MKPMLAAKDVDKNLWQIRFPVLCSPKLDGIRCLIVGGKPVSRTLKPIPNKYINSILSRPELEGLDGELIVGEPNAEDVYLQTNSGVMSHEGEPAFAYYVFDSFTSTLGFEGRSKSLYSDLSPPIEYWNHVYIRNIDELLEYEAACLDKGYEGVIIRAPDAMYKFGRSTLKEQGMMKLKRFTDAEAVIVDIIELEHNDNAATINELGHTKRSTAQAGKRAGGTMGALLMHDHKTGVVFNIGSGFTAQMRKDIWENRAAMAGRFVKYKYFHIGVKEETGIPRHPIFLGFRDPIDFEQE